MSAACGRTTTVYQDDSEVKCDKCGAMEVAGKTAICKQCGDVFCLACTLSSGTIEEYTDDYTCEHCMSLEPAKHNMFS